jgi:hypothetical protein
MMPPKKRNTPLQAHHVDEFGLRKCERAVGNSTAVATTACRFCEVFGKEESEVGMKRGRSERVKYLNAPCRKENYSSHHRRMHSTQWAEYRELEPSAKKSFFAIGTISGSQTTMHAFAAPCNPQLRVLIDKDIVDDVIIGEMTFHPEDMDGITRVRLLEIFAPTLDSSEDAANAGDVNRYHHRHQHQAVSVGCTIFGCWTVVPSGFPSDYGDERGTRHRKHWLVL